MLTHIENDTLTRVGPGTTMGNLFRRYWLPALLSWELPEPDCSPVRLRLLGEDLIAFRDTTGAVGIVDNYCPHRRASLFFGRNEEAGIRCVYHGWKFDVHGDCVDMPSEPAESNFKDKVKITAYPTEEFGGIVWTYMGPADVKPPAPKMEWTQVPDTHRGVTKVVQPTGWLQGLEGGIDTVHSTFLHRRLAGFGIGARDQAFRRSASAIVEVVPTNYGYTYAGLRPLPDDAGVFVRGYHFILPFYQLRAAQLGSVLSGRSEVRRIVSGHAWVPMDDTHTMVWNYTYSFGDDPLTESDQQLYGSGNELGKDIDAANGFRAVANADNDYFIDREMQRTVNYTGIQGINVQDRAVQESMGAICDRTKEHLGTTDRAIIMARRIMLQAARTVEDGGDPPGLGTDIYTLRAIEKILPAGVHWRDALHDELYNQRPYFPEYTPA